jgi:hypothetical protein
MHGAGAWHGNGCHLRLRLRLRDQRGGYKQYAKHIYWFVFSAY